MPKDIVLGFIALVFSGFYIVEASRIPTSFLSDAVGAGGIPVILGWIMAGAAILLIIHQLRLRLTGRAVPAKTSPAFSEPGRLALIAGGIVAMAALYIAVLPSLGYIPATILLLMAMLFYQRVPPSMRIVLVPIAGTVVLWLLFDAFLGINLPDGVLERIF